MSYHTPSPSGQVHICEVCAPSRFLVGTHPTQEHSHHLSRRFPRARNTAARIYFNGRRVSAYEVLPDQDTCEPCLGHIDLLLRRPDALPLPLSSSLPCMGTPACSIALLHEVGMVQVILPGETPAADPEHVPAGRPV